MDLKQGERAELQREDGGQIRCWLTASASSFLLPHLPPFPPLSLHLLSPLCWSLSSLTFVSAGGEWRIADDQLSARSKNADPPSKQLTDRLVQFASRCLRHALRSTLDHWRCEEQAVESDNLTSPLSSPLCLPFAAVPLPPSARRSSLPLLHRLHPHRPVSRCPSSLVPRRWVASSLLQS
jgi:hypothetical protein